MTRAKAQLRAGLLMTLESPIARAGQMARHILIHGRPLTLEETIARVDAVTGDDLIALGGEACSDSVPDAGRDRARESLPGAGEIAGADGRAASAV